MIFFGAPRDLPGRGRIAIFNRSYYEEVLVVRVHPDILHREAIPDAPHHDKKVWRERYRSINDFEKHLNVNGTRIVKFFLHLSKEEQRKRFLERIDDPKKNWKLSDADLKERKFWNDYAKAYEECLSATSTDDAPWFVVPADDKENARLIVSQIVLDTFEGLKMNYPKMSAEREEELQSIRKQLSNSSPIARRQIGQLPGSSWVDLWVHRIGDHAALVDSAVDQRHACADHLWTAVAPSPLVSAAAYGARSSVLRSSG